jgi:hypothetical protein
MPEPMLKTRSHRMFQHKGVIIGFYYDTWEVFFSSNPATIWFAKQDGLYSEDSVLMNFAALPFKIRDKALEQVVEAKEILVSKVLEKRKIEQDVKDAANKAVIDNWTKYEGGRSPHE